MNSFLKPSHWTLISLIRSGSRDRCHRGSGRRNLWCYSMFRRMWICLPGASCGLVGSARGTRVEDKRPGIDHWLVRMGRVCGALDSARLPPARPLALDPMLMCRQYEEYLCQNWASVVRLLPVRQQERKPAWNQLSILWNRCQLFPNFPEY